MLAWRPLCLIAFAAPPIVALAVCNARIGTIGGAGVAIAAVLYLGGLVVLAFAVRRTLRRGLELRFHNELLLQEFRETNNDLRVALEQGRSTESELERRDQILSTVRFVSQRLLGKTQRDSDPRTILERLGQAAQTDRVFLVQHPKGHGPPLAHHWQSSPQRRESLGIEHDLAHGFHDGLRALAEGSLVIVDQNTATQKQKKLLEHHGIESLALLPVRTHEQADSSVLGFEHHQPGPGFTDPELEALHAAAGMLGAAIKGMRIEDALQESTDRFRLLADNASDLVCLHRADGRLLYVSPSSESLAGIPPEDLTGRDPWPLLHRHDRNRVRRALAVSLGRNRPMAVTFRITHRGGGTRWLEARVQAVSGEGPQSAMIISTSRDISARKEAEVQLYNEKELAQVTLGSIADGVITTDRRSRIRFMNPVAEAMLQLRSADATGLKMAEVLATLGTNSETVWSLVSKALNAQRAVSSGEPILVQSPSGNELAVEVSSAPIRDSQMRVMGTVTVLHDVTSNRALADQLTYQATHDSLTGLLNRAEFEERLRESFARRRSGEDDALCYLDLDQFKIVNDTCGHIAGDELLRQLAGVLRSRTRSTDIVARLGGDEFGVLLTGCPPERALQVGNAICEAVRSFRFQWEDRVFQLGVSIGVVPINADQPSNITELLSEADSACYAAKDQGRNRVHLHKEGDATVAQRKSEMEWVSQIHGALEDNRFELYFQPIVRAQTHQDPNQIPMVPSVVERANAHADRVELLLRMRSEDGELIPPGTFIPAAERFNAMPTIDRWVIREALESFAEHWRTGINGSLVQCFINLSGTSLADRSFGPFVKEQLARHAVPPDALCFEITETAAIANLNQARDLMNELRALGCRFALDDFGSGLSSFAYLRNLPVDYLKIDGVFVKAIEHDLVDLSIVESISKVGKQLGLEVIAEFVETISVRNRLIELGVDYLQGFQVARPAPVAALLESLAESARAPEPLAH